MGLSSKVSRGVGHGTVRVTEVDTVRCIWGMRSVRCHQSIRGEDLKGGPSSRGIPAAYPSSASLIGYSVDVCGCRKEEIMSSFSPKANVCESLWRQLQICPSHGSLAHLDLAWKQEEGGGLGSQDGFCMLSQHLGEMLSPPNLAYYWKFS